MGLKDLWFCTYSGKRFHPFDPRPDEICLVDIAHHLSLTCRFNGACRDFYSVAQHSVMVSSLCEPQNALWGLLHDATEAYIGDMVRPLKMGIEQYRDIEALLESVIAEKCGLPMPMPGDVKRADEIALYVERRDLMSTIHPWSKQAEMDPIIEDIPPIEPWTPRLSESEFRSRLILLLGVRVD